MTGIGGQGIQLVAKLLAQAAIREEKQVMMFGLFMGTIRGGSSESTVVGDAHLDAALHELVVEGGELTRSLLGYRPTSKPA